MTKTPLHPLLKLVLEFGPLVIFFLANQKLGIFQATALFMMVTLVSLGLTFFLTRHLAIMPLVSGIVVAIFGGLTLFLNDDLFIKIKPTLVNSLFGLILLGGLFFGRSFLSILMGAVFQLDEDGWRKLTFRWGLFFLLLAVINEVVWRTQTTDLWVSFKVFGIMPLTVLFALSQTPLLMRHAIPENLPEEKQKQG